MNNGKGKPQLKQAAFDSENQLRLVEKIHRKSDGTTEITFGDKLTPGANGFEREGGTNLGNPPRTKRPPSMSTPPMLEGDRDTEAKPPKNVEALEIPKEFLDGTNGKLEEGRSYEYRSLGAGAGVGVLEIKGAGSENADAYLNDDDWPGSEDFFEEGEIYTVSDGKLVPEEVGTPANIATAKQQASNTIEATQKAFEEGRAFSLLQADEAIAEYGRQLGDQADSNAEFQSLKARADLMRALYDTSSNPSEENFAKAEELLNKLPPEADSTKPLAAFLAYLRARENPSEETFAVARQLINELPEDALGTKYTNALLSYFEAIHNPSAENILNAQEAIAELPDEIYGEKPEIMQSDEKNMQSDERLPYGMKNLLLGSLPALPAQGMTISESDDGVEEGDDSESNRPEPPLEGKDII